MYFNQENGPENWLRKTKCAGGKCYLMKLIGTHKKSINYFWLSTLFLLSWRLNTGSDHIFLKLEKT